MAQMTIEELLSQLNSHAGYPANFVPISVQAEPLDLIESAQEEKLNRAMPLPQLRAKYEFDLMHSSAVLYMADMAGVRRFDFQMPHRLSS